MESYSEMSNYMLELPLALQTRQIYPKFHVSLLCPHYTNNDALFLNCDQPEPYNFGASEDAEWFIEEIISHHWPQSNRLELQVQWSLGNMTWEPLAHCEDLVALDHYLEVMGITLPKQLPKKAGEQGNQMPQPMCGRQAWQH